ncbi:MAG: ribonuclease D [Proteobacteria bacterium]|nr:ribonuclease D [Pseudomonadota bacterium]
MSLITKNDELKDFCARLSTAEFVTVDTEFLRDKTYWPILCLVQLGGPDEAAAIDTLAEGLDLEPLFELMRNPGVLKVFHAGRQDFEIFFRQMGELPNPVFDTQVSAMVCGFGDSVGYETLVSQLLRKSIDKTMRFTDWGRRPLSDKQLIYALGDVTHLRVVYEKLRDKLKTNDRYQWVAEEMAHLNNPAIYQTDPRETWRRLKVRSTKPKFLAILREVAALREEEAQRRDVPRNRVLRDDALTEIAAHAPKTRDELISLRALHQGQINGAMGDAILAAVDRGLNVKNSDCPVPARERASLNKTGPATDLLKVLLKVKCDAHGVAQKLIASSDDIEAIAQDDNADVPALRGWRRDIFGSDALALKHGRLAMTANGSKIMVVPVPD